MDGLNLKKMKSSAEFLYDAIIERMIGGELRSGDVLSEVALAREHSISRTPVREALQRLRREGVLALGPRRTLVVRSMDRTELQALFEALGAVEGICARLAALRMRDVDIHRLARIVDEGDGNPADFNDINARFHAALRDGADNPVLHDLLRDLQLRSLPLRAMQFRLRQDRVAISQQEHREIYDAVAQRNGHLAEQRMVQHMAATQSVILDILAD